MKIWAIILFMSAALLPGTICSSQELKSGDTVWAQWRPNEWYPGKLADKTTLGFIVNFDDGDRAELPVALIVTDTPPAQEQLAVGARVLAPWTGVRFYPGTVMAISDSGGFQIQFDDGDRTVAPLAKLRTLPPGNPTYLKTGDIVWAQWKPNSWSHGRIAGKGILGFHVEFDDGDKADLPPALIATDRPAQEEQLRIGSRVLARWTDNRYYPGTVTAKTEEGGYAIRFDDNDNVTAPPLDIRILGE